MPEHDLQDQELDDKDREILLWIALGLSYDVRIFTERLAQEVDRLTRAGVNQQSIIGFLTQDLTTNGRIFGEFRNSIKRGIVGGINQAFRRAGEVGQKLKWVTVSKNICSDCESRAGQSETWDTWQSLGMPGSGWSICKEHCYCQLVPDSFDVDDKLQL